MERGLRNDLRLAVIVCRKLLTDDFGRQLQGEFGVGANGRIEDETALPQLNAAGLRDRRAIVAAIMHLRDNGAPVGEAVERFVREAAFSTLNRLVAIKLLEAPERKLIPESIGKGTGSRGFLQFLLISKEAVAEEPDGGYRLYLDLLCGDLSREIGVLFDLRSPHGLLFPGELALRGVLEQINAPALASVWAEDETLGWVYQYFTPKELRDSARKASAAPRDANELAFRNQFYTPRYVVEFLVENTLGRIWYEARRGETALADGERCRYLVRRKHPIWLEPSEAPPEPFPESSASLTPDNRNMWLRPNPALTGWSLGLIAYAQSIDGYVYATEHFGVDLMEFGQKKREDFRRNGRWDGTFEELRVQLFYEQRAHYWSQGPGSDDDETGMPGLNQALCERWDYETEAIPYRSKTDPRELRILDPACGSGHFLLYAFDLLQTIYREAWEDPHAPQFKETGRRLRWDYPDEATLERALPELILRNLHGLDIDLRAVQIAQLALWLRAQRAWEEQGIRPADRPPVTRLDIVVAEQLPGDKDMFDEFRAAIDGDLIRRLVGRIWAGMSGAGEIGSLMKTESLVSDVIGEAKRDWDLGSIFEQSHLFAEQVPMRQGSLLISTFDSEKFWNDLDALLRRMLRRYAETAGADRYRRRLFVDDAVEGLAFLEFFDKPFDVVLMNPPFGAVSHGARAFIERHYPKTKNDLYAAFIERGLEILCTRGYLGAITSRTGFFLTSFQKWREEVILSGTRIHAVADLGQGVLDTAMVETAAYVLEKRP